MTGGRIKRAQKYINDETFLLTYGDEVSDVDIKVKMDFHKKHKKISNYDGRMGGLVLFISVKKELLNIF